MKTCSLENCDAKHYAKSYCINHFNRFRRHGDPLAGRVSPHKGESGVEKIMRRVKVDPETNCWVYTHNNNRKNKHAVISVRGNKDSLVHRIVWKHLRGDIPESLVVRHKCNTYSCVNIDHLELGTVADNNKDKEIRYTKALIVMELLMRCPTEVEFITNTEYGYIDCYLNGELVKTVRDARSVDYWGSQYTMEDKVDWPELWKNLP